MEIKIVNNGLWGGVIPDILRNNRIVLQTKNLEITFESDEFDELRKCFDDKTQKLFSDAQNIVIRFDKRAKAMQLIEEPLSELLEVRTGNSEIDKKLYKIWDRISDAYNQYWSFQ